MKKIRFSILAIAALLFLGSCSKHKMWFPIDKMPEDWAEFQIHYFEPSANAASYNMDTVYINDVIYGSKDGGTTLQYNNGLPRFAYGSTAIGKFYGVKAGNVNIKCMRRGEVVYDQNMTLTVGKQNVIIHDLNQPPIVIDNQFPYWNAVAPATGENWNTDSVGKVMFINLLYESPGVPYPGKLQYQWKRRSGTEWANIGEPVGFGEATERTPVIIHKTVFNSSGYENVDYRILTESGDELQKWNGSKYVTYSDYWNCYIGKVYMHFFRGYRTTTPACNVTQWQSM
ncbi:MAG: hypothetical protein IK103_02935 [Bacteroidales bacterium]|nr:hypothetical protein [Bacteroidales bacterium]